MSYSSILLSGGTIFLTFAIKCIVLSGGFICLVFLFLSIIVLIKIAILTKALAVVVLVFVLTLGCFARPPIQMVAVVAHAFRVVGQVRVRALCY